MKSAYCHFKFLSLGLGTLSLTIFHCSCPTQPDYSIDVEGVRIASRTGDREDSVLDFVTDLENPSIRGVVTVGDLEFTRDRYDILTCCTRSFIETDEPWFLPLSNNAFLSITNETIVLPTSSGLYGYTTQPIALPDNGSSVQLRLNVDGRVVAWGNVRLSEDVIVIPVNVHIFKAAGDGAAIPSYLNERNVRSWFDLPNIQTRAETVTRPVRTTVITERNDWSPPTYSSVDPVWRQAKIQFKLASYEVIEQNDRLELDLYNATEVSYSCRFPQLTRLFRYHEDRMNTPGIHIYLGALIASQSLSIDDVPGFTCGASGTCRSSGNQADFIGLSHLQATSLPLTLAHELGHYLGLDHPYSDFSCGAHLFEESDSKEENLMNPVPTHINLTERQIVRARELACAHLRRWGITSAGCSSDP